MCSLWGAYSSVLTKDEKSNVMLLGLLGATRGLDSTGLVAIGRNDKKKTKYSMHKALGNSCSFFETKDAMRVLSLESSMLLMGHTRQATNGEINLRNAQPIEEGHIIGCHNGSINHFFDEKKKDHH